MIDTIAGSMVGNTIGLLYAPISQWSSGIVAANLAPQMYQRQRNAWIESPLNLMPDPGALLSAYSNKWIDREMLAGGLRNYGIAFHSNIGLPALDPRLTPDERRLALRQQSNKADLWDAIQRSHLIRPSIDMAVKLFSSGLITEDRLRIMIEQSGGDPDSWLWLKDSLYTPLDLGTLLTAQNRGYLNQDQVTEGLKRLGYLKPLQRGLLDRMREVLPSVSDLITFAVRDVWDRQIVDSNRLFDDLPPQFVDAANRQGYFGLSGARYSSPVGEKEATWAELNWAAHWQPMPLGVAYDAFHRLRPGRPERYNRDGIKPGVFTIEQLNGVIKQADYPPGVREAMAAMSFQPLQLRQVNAAIKANVRLSADVSYGKIIGPELVDTVATYDRQWAIDQFLDRGLITDDAEVAADLAIVAARESVQSPMLAFERKQDMAYATGTLDAYRIGVVDRQTAEQALLAVGISTNGVGNALATVDLKVKTKEFQTAINAIRSDFMQGILDELGMNQALVDAGMDRDRRIDTANLWTIYRNRRRKTATTSQLLKWLEEGLVSLADVQFRLNNLGWNQSDSLTLLREANLRVAKLQAKVILANQQSARKASRELESSQRQAKAIQRQTVLDLRRTLPSSSLLKAFRKGLVTAQYVTQRLLAQEYPLETINLWIREAAGLSRPRRTVTDTITTTVDDGTGKSKSAVEIVSDTQTAERPLR